MSLLALTVQRNQPCPLENAAHLPSVLCRDSAVQSRGLQPICKLSDARNSMPTGKLRTLHGEAADAQMLQGTADHDQRLEGLPCLASDLMGCQSNCEIIGV